MIQCFAILNLQPTPVPRSGEESDGAGPKHKESVRGACMLRALMIYFCVDNVAVAVSAMTWTLSGIMLLTSTIYVGKLSPKFLPPI